MPIRRPQLMFYARRCAVRPSAEHIAAITSKLRSESVRSRAFRHRDAAPFDFGFVNYEMRCSRRAARALAERRWRGGEPRDRHAKRRARDIVELDLVAELNRGRIAAVLAANAELQLLTRLAAALGGDAHQLADAVAIDRHKRVGRQDALCRVGTQEAPRVVAADAKGGLRQVVGAERKELRRFGDLIGFERRTRQFDHGADLIMELASGLLRNLLRRGVD